MTSKGIAGFFSSIGAGAVVAIACTMVGWVWVTMFIGVVQLIYVVPVCISRWKTDKIFAKGVIIGAAVVFILNSLCWGFVGAIMLSY